MNLSQVNFYKLTKDSLEKILPRLMEKIYISGKKAVILSASSERVEHLNYCLWTYTPLSFLPHGSALDECASEQPIWLTDTLERPNDAEVLIVTEGVALDLSLAFQKVLCLFSGHNKTECLQASALYEQSKKQGISTVFWEQQMKGWEKKEEILAKASSTPSFFYTLS